MYFANPDILVGSVVVLCLFIALTVLEVNRASKRKYGRIFTTFILALSLFMLFARPVVRRTVEKSKLIILTPRFREAQLDSLTSVYPSASIADWDTLQSAFNRFNKIFVIGSGIPLYDIWKLEGLDVNYLGAPSIPGYQAIHFPDRVVQDEVVRIMGRYSNVAQDSLKLRLRLYDMVCDSTFLAPGLNQPFELTATALLPGKFEFSIEIYSKDSVVSTETIPLEILGSRKYRILMVNTFPTFELRYLKNYLVNDGHEVIVRNNISKERFAYERYNTTLPNLTRLTQEYLSKFDILLLDLGTLSTFNGYERNEMVKSVQNGLSLFFLPEENLFSYRSHLLPGFTKLTSDGSRTKLKKSDVNITSFPFRIEPSFNNEELIVDDEAVGFKTYWGRGSVNSVYLTHTYPLQLRGDSIAYRHLWRNVLDQVITRTDSLKVVRTRFPVCNEPLRVLLMGNNSLPIRYEQSRVGVDESFLKGRNSFKLWPTQPGWNNFSTNEAEHWFYVYDESQWTSIRDRRKSIKNTSAFINLEDQVNTGMVERELQGLIFYLVILCCLGFLWVEPKL